jgi:hypothetical protein
MEFVPNTVQSSHWISRGCVGSIRDKIWCNKVLLIYISCVNCFAIKTYLLWYSYRIFQHLTIAFFDHEQVKFERPSRKNKKKQRTMKLIKDE